MTATDGKDVMLRLDDVQSFYGRIQALKGITLEIARALATEPRLLLLDEPTAGMNPREADALTELIGLLRRELGLAVLLIEHHMEVVMGISDRITVLDYGTRIAEGTPAEIRQNAKVIEAYLGKGYEQELVTG